MSLSSLLKSNKLIIKNYLSLTFLQAVNAFFYIIIFPLVVPKIGIDSYGTFVYITAILSFLSIIINFGFDLPGLRRIAASKPSENNKIYFSSVFYIKKILFIISSIITLLVFLIFEIDNYEVYFICMIGVLSNVYLFNWYFQGKQIVTHLATIQATSKIIALILIIILVNNKNDFLKFAIIINLLTFLGSLASFFYLKNKFIITLSTPKLKDMKESWFEALPFFWVSAIGLAKYRSIEVIIGIFFGVKEVALYDLANKIYSIPSILSTSINTSIFPKFAQKNSLQNIHKVFLIEFWIALIVFISIVLFGEFAVELLGKGLLSEAYYMLILMSLNIFTFLTVGCYVYFIFVPNNKGNLVFRNQIFALISFIIILPFTLAINWSVYSVILSLVFSGFIEILYCRHLVKKHHLLKGLTK